MWIHVVVISALQLVPPLGMLNNPMNAVTTKFVRTSTNKVKCPVFVIRVRCICVTVGDCERVCVRVSVHPAGRFFVCDHVSVSLID